jgi:hypothetical protein
MSVRPSRLGILAIHPIQYYASLYRALAAHPDIDGLLLPQPERGRSRKGWKAGRSLPSSRRVPRRFTCPTTTPALPMASASSRSRFRHSSSVRRSVADTAAEASVGALDPISRAQILCSPAKSYHQPSPGGACRESRFLCSRIRCR